MKEQPVARIESHDLPQWTGNSHVTERMVEASPQRWARIAGALYLIIIAGGFFAIGYVPAVTVVPGDATATAHTILTHELLYRLGLAAHILVLACNIPLTLIFYYLFKVVNRSMTLLVVFFLLMGNAVEGANMLNQFAPLLFLEGEHYLSVFNTAQLQALAYMPFDLQTMSFNIQQVFYGCYCLLTGYLVFRSTFLPRTVGVLLAIGGLCYLTNSFATFVAPGFAAFLFPYIQVPSLVGEASLCLWLLVAGVNVARWEKQVSSVSDLAQSVAGRATVS